MYGVTIAIVLVSVLKLSSSSLCKICTCSETGGTKVFDCDKKLETNVSDLNLLIYLNNDQPEKFILSSNKLTESSLEPLKNWNNLKIIDLSHNFLNGSEVRIFQYWPQLDDLDLSFNKWITFDSPSLIATSSLTKLNLSHNFITNLDPATSLNESRLTYLDLSHNKLTTIAGKSLNVFPHLRCINLSFNSISKIDSHAFIDLLSLDTVLLEHNFLKILEANFPKSLNTLVVRHNEITKFPCNLSVNYLSIDSNSILTIPIENKNMYNQLTHLNLSKNLLSSFVDAEFPILVTLDISHNNFTNIPATVTTKNFPRLDTLILSGNPISELKFNADIKLRNLIVHNLNLLEKVNDDAFENLKEYDNDCINMTISFNEQLELFDEKAVENMSICYMDLGNNALKRISQNMRGLQDKQFFRYGLNLQGNPLVCDCASQWMLDKLIPKLYDLNPELLTDLRCNEPPGLSKVRMIHWYKWENQIFCDDWQLMSQNIIANDSATIYMEPMGSTVVIESSKTMLLVITSCAILLAILVIIGLTFSLKLAYKRRRVNRRF